MNLSRLPQAPTPGELLENVRYATKELASMTDQEPEDPPEPPEQPPAAPDDDQAPDDLDDGHGEP